MEKTPKPRKTYGISRIAQATTNTHGWYVRVGKSGAFFSDKKHGSKAKALKAAATLRDTLFEGLPPKLQAAAARPRSC